MDCHALCQYLIGLLTGLIDWLLTTEVLVWFAYDMMTRMWSGTVVLVLPLDRPSAGTTIWGGVTTTRCTWITSLLTALRYSFTKFLHAMAKGSWRYSSPNCHCSLFVWGRKAGFNEFMSYQLETKNAPSFWKATSLFLSCRVIQHGVQNLVWECDAKPPILWVASLSQTIATSMTHTKWPARISLQAMLWWLIKYVPSFLDSVGITIPSLHNCKRSEMIGWRNCWISSRFCSLGPGRILIHKRFDVRYLENQQ